MKNKISKDYWFLTYKKEASAGMRTNINSVELWGNYLKDDEILIAGMETRGTGDRNVYLTNKRIVKPKKKVVKTGFLSSKWVLEDDISISLKDVVEISKTYSTDTNLLIGMVEQVPTVEIKTQRMKHSFSITAGFNAGDMERISTQFVELVNKELVKIQPKVSKQEKDIPTMLREYAKLRDDGIITEAEFQKKKATLLNGE